MTNDDEEELNPPPRKNLHLVGHERAEAVLLDAWNSGRLPHAWLISGPRGIGKATLAHRFARFVLSDGGGEERGLFGDAAAALPAGSMAVSRESPIFQRIASGGHADLFTLERTIPPEPEKRLRNMTADEIELKKRKSIIVEDVRRATSFMRRTAAEGGWRVVVVDCADEMTTSAANAVLKILEEPPPQALFLMVSHAPGRLLPTIRSRCRRLVLSPLAHEQVSSLLAEFRPDLTAEDRRTLAGLADGSIGEALRLADAGGLELYREMVRMLGTLGRLDIAGAHALGEKVGRKDREEEYATLATLLERWLARLVVQAASKQPPHHIVRGERAIGAELLQRAPLDQWMEVWEKVTRLMAKAGSANLDRKQVVIGAFLMLDAAVTSSTAATPA